MTKSEIQERARLLTDISDDCAELPTYVVRMIAAVARDQRDGQARAREAARLREEKTAVEWRTT